MNATDVLVLPAGVLVERVDALEPKFAERVEHDHGDFVLSRWIARTILVVDSDGLLVLKQFTSPKTVVEAIIDASKGTHADPEVLLAEALPLIVRARRLRLLLLADSTQAGEIDPTLVQGEHFRGYRTVACVHLFEDVEVYRVTDMSGRYLALKMGRPRSTRRGGTDPARGLHPRFLGWR